VAARLRGPPRWAYPARAWGEGQGSALAPHSQPSESWRMRIRGSCCLLLTLALLACSESDAGLRPGASQEDAGHRLIEEEDFAQALSDAFAEQVRRCCLQAGLSFTASGPPVFVPDPDSGAQYDREAGSLCVAETARAPCSLAKEPWTSFSPVCASAWKGGSRAVGAPCKSEWECAPSKVAGVIVTCPVSVTSDGWKDAQCYEQTFLNDGDACEGIFPSPQCVYPSFCHPE
jgi:hypothetical protein